MTHILIINGSPRKNGNSKWLIEQLQPLWGDHISVSVYDETGQLPVYTPDAEEAGSIPETVQALRQVVEQSDGLVFVTPEYNASIPGSLKAAIDWLSRPYGEAAITHKPAIVIGGSASPFGAQWAQESLLKILPVAGAEVVYDKPTSIVTDDELLRNGLFSNYNEDDFRQLFSQVVVAAQTEAAMAE